MDERARERTDGGHRPAKPLLSMLAAIFAILLLAACGDDQDPSVGAGTTVPPGEAGRGMTVEQAKQRAGGQSLAVRGHLFVVSGKARLCGAIAESFPPQCAGATLDVVGLDENAYTFSQEQAVRWTEKEVRVIGTVEGDRLTVAPEEA